ncbi:MAG: aa3-type cytochrome c oxidase subunit IV [Alphaproteobacteria bacterium]|nr:aa3-type cytochrome c oxidase subunit IV [Alphaproteobacteria bacterium]
MAVTSTTDPLLAQHYRTWRGFTRLIRYVLAAIVIILLLMAYFLL